MHAPLTRFRTQLKELQPLSTSRRERVRNAASVAAIYANALAGRQILRVPALVVAGEGGTATGLCVESAAHLDVAAHVFARGAYEDHRIDEADTIVDVGGNIGLASLFFAIRYPRARVLCVEPARAPKHLLCKNVAQFAGRITLVPAAVGNENGSTTLYEMPFDVGSSVVARDGAVASYEVPVRTLSTLLREADIERVDILKIDAEGAEWDILREVGQLNVRVVMAELHLDLCGASLDEFREALATYDVTITEGEGPRRYDLVAIRRECLSRYAS